MPTSIPVEIKGQLSTGCRNRAEAWAGEHDEWAAQIDLLGDHVGAAITYEHLERALRAYFDETAEPATWRGVLYVAGQPDLPKPKWGAFTDAVAVIVGVGGEATVVVPNLIIVNVGTVENPVWRSSEYMVMANFNRSIINPKTIKNWLVAIFGVNPATVTYEVDSFTVDARPTAYADYAYNGVFMLRIAFFGLETQNTTCTAAESRNEAEAWIAANPNKWESLP